MVGSATPVHEVRKKQLTPPAPSPRPKAGGDICSLRSSAHPAPNIVLHADLSAAGIGRRLAGMFYESLLLLGVISALVLLPHLLIGVIWQAALPGWAIWLNVVAAAGLYFVYQWRRSGQTLAMKTWRMQIVAKEDGQPPPTRRALLRYLLAWPSVLSGIGLLWALFDRDRQFLHDRLAGTVVICVQPTTASSPPPAER